MDLALNNKTALVTGANRGTGQAIAATLLAEGAQVVLHGNEPHNLPENLQQQFAGSIYSVCGDIRSDSGAAQVVEQTFAQIEGVDILVNNYGTGTRGDWANASEEDYLAMYQTNVLSATRMVQGFVDAMKAKGWGRIIQLGTIGSHQPNSTMPHYYASKGALATLMVSLANDLANTGITVNTVSPGLIRTAEVEAGYQAMAKRKGWGDDWQAIERQIATSEFPNPCGRIATREEVADLVAFIASPRAGFINGENIRIDGGAVRFV